MISIMIVSPFGGSDIIQHLSEDDFFISSCEDGLDIPPNNAFVAVSSWNKTQYKLKCDGDRNISVSL